MEEFMGRRSNQEQGPSDRSKIRFVYAEADANIESMQELLRAVGAVIKPAISPPTVRYLPRPGALPSPTGTVEDESLEEHPLFEGLEEAQESVVDGTVVAESQENGKQRRRRGAGPKVARNAGIELVSGLDFVQEGKQSLKEFFVEKAPKTDMEQIVVFGHFMQEVMELDDFSPGHVLSAYKHIGNITVPLDLKATLRNMKRDKGWLTFTDMDHMRVDTEGGNYVKTELGKEKVKPR
jgi:hypothetical protein